ncbi:MAG: polysaccharide deacetylase family protein [Bacteroidetes bacterium]|nr:polysaccharide deacetylase family protein [Bacteroidota bacterium]
MTERTVRIAAGIFAPTPGWESLLEQTGIDWFPVTDLRTITPELCTLVICNTELDPHEMDALRAYATTGGAVIFTSAAESVLRTAGTRSSITSLPPAVRHDHWFTDVLDLHGPAWVFKDGSLVQSGPIGKGMISYFGADVETVFTSEASTRKAFYAERKHLPHERTALRTRMPLRQMFLSHIGYLHHQRHLPFVHKWFYPRDSRSIFTFRIDSDKGTREEIEEIYALSEQYSVPTTWFLDVKSHEAWLERFRSFGGQEIAVHCYDHVIHPSSLLNRENFERALMLLKKHGIDAAGIAAPTGAWRHSVGTAIRDLGFEYSSEFSYDYDDLPSFPRLNGVRSESVQLPVHPTCIGTMRRERMGHDEMVRYFIRVTDRALALREPVCLYHHPGHRTNSVFEEVFQYIRSTGVGMMTYREYAAWWKRRDAARIQCTWSGGVLRCSSSDVPQDQFLRIMFPDGSETITAPNAAIDTGALERTTAPVLPAVPLDIMRTRQWRPAHLLQNVLDWWITTTE